MRIIASLLAASALAFAACEEQPGSNRPTGTATSPSTTNTTPSTTPGTTPGTTDPNRTPATTTPPETTRTPPGTSNDQGQTEADRRLAADVKRILAEDQMLTTDAANINVMVKDGTVTLRGTVRSQAAKDAAEAKARTVAGVTDVQNEIEVENP